MKIISQKNKGLGGARNTGITNASGTYLLFLDSDDWYIKNTLSNILEIAIKNDLEILEFGAQGVTVDEKVTYNVTHKTSENIIGNGIDYIINFKGINSACNKLYNKDFLLKNKLFFTEKIYAEDLEFNTRTFFFAKKVMATNQPIACFLQSENSITRSKDNTSKKKYIADLISILLKIKLFKETNQNKNSSRHTKYFNERMTSICIGVFQELFKMNADYQEVISIKKRLINNDVYYVKYDLFDPKRNFFRKYFVGYNFFLFRIAIFIKKIIGS